MQSRADICRRLSLSGVCFRTSESESKFYWALLSLRRLFYYSVLLFLVIANTIKVFYIHIICMNSFMKNCNIVTSCSSKHSILMTIIKKVMSKIGLGFTVLVLVMQKNKIKTKTNTILRRARLRPRLRLSKSWSCYKKPSVISTHSY